MPHSFGRALINKGAPFPIYQANLGAPFTQGHAPFTQGGAPFTQGRALLPGARPSPRGAPFSQGCALFNLSSSFECALTNRGAHSSILLGKLKHTLSHL